MIDGKTVLSDLDLGLSDSLFDEAPAENSKPKSALGFDWEAMLGFTDETEYTPLQLIYGQPGTGKTTYGAGAVAAGLKPLILDCDRGGTFTLRGKHIPRIGIESWPQCEFVITALVNGKAQDYDVILVDTASVLQDTCWVHVTSRGRKKDQRQEWNVVAERMGFVLQQLKSTHIPIVVLAHERQYRNEEGDLANVAPALAPSVYKTVAAYSDLIGRIMDVEVPAKKGTKHIKRLWVGPHAIYDAKLRDIDLPDFIDNPTFVEVWEAIKKGPKNA